MEQLSLFTDEELGLHVGEVKDGMKLMINKFGRLQRFKVGGRVTLQQFIERARPIWGDDYDYSESVLTGMKEPITIRCKKHNHYFTVPFAQNHVIKAHGNVKPTGCPICTEERTGIRPPRGPHHFRTQEEIRQAEEAKAQRKAERERLAAERKANGDEEAKRKRQEERQRKEQELMQKYGAKTVPEALFIEKLIAKYGDIYGRDFLEYKDRETPVTLVCKEHGPFKIKPRTLLTREKHCQQPCGWQCYGIKDPHDKPAPMTSDEFFAKMHELYGDRFDFSKSVYINKHTPITFICNKHGEQTNQVETLLKGKGCDYCSGRKFYWPDFERLAREKHGDKYDYRYVRPKKNMQGMVTIICPVHGRFKQRAALHLLGYGCRECVGYPNKKSPEQRCQEFIAKCKKKYGDHYDYSRFHEDYQTNDSVCWIRCTIHDHWFQAEADTHRRSVNGCCPICTQDYLESEGERTVRLWLEAHGIDHRTQEQLPNEDPTLPLQFVVADFWIDDFQRHPMIIEYNGQQHYEDVPFYYQGRPVRSFAVQQHRDRYLRKYCSEHGISLLEIPYWDFERIDEILSERLLE